MSDKANASQTVLGEMNPSRAITKLAFPAILALLAKAVYNIVDTAYIGMLDSDIALTAVGVTVPLLLIMVSIENIFASVAAVLAGRQLGADEADEASRTVTTILGLSIVIGILLCIGGIIFIEPLMRTFGASDTSLPLAKDYAFWMFVAALANLPAQCMNCAARAESSVKISSIAVITGALLNILLDPVFMFDWGLGMGVEGASLATTISQFVTFFLLMWFYLSGRSVIKLHIRSFRPSGKLIWTVTSIGIPTAVIQICLSVASSLTNIAAAYILLSRPLILLFNNNPVIVNYGRWLLISQVVLYPAFGLCYMMTITFQTIGESKYGLFLSMIRQGLFYVPFILTLPRILGVKGIYLSQPLADIFTLIVCFLSVKKMKQIAEKRDCREINSPK